MRLRHHFQQDAWVQKHYDDLGARQCSAMCREPGA